MYGLKARNSWTKLYIGKLRDRVTKTADYKNWHRLTLRFSRVVSGKGLGLDVLCRFKVRRVVRV